MTKEIINRQELMALFGYKDKDCFRKKLRDITDFEGFPPPLPLMPNKWSYKQVMAWLGGIRPNLEKTVTNAPEQQNNGFKASTLDARLNARRFELIEGGLYKT